MVKSGELYFEIWLSEVEFGSMRCAPLCLAEGTKSRGNLDGYTTISLPLRESKPTFSSLEGLYYFPPLRWGRKKVGVVCTRCFLPLDGGG